MPDQFEKFAPTAVVALVVIWCCWPYLFGSNLPLVLEEPGGPPVIANEMLSPTLAEKSSRDPFAAAVDERSLEKAGPPSAAGMASLQSASASRQVSNGAAEAKAADTTQDPLAVASRFVLGATYVQGKRRIAMINGKIYAEGDRLMLSGPAEAPCVVTKISAQMVRIEQGDRAVEIGYPTRETQPPATPRGEANR